MQLTKIFPSLLTYALGKHDKTLVEDNITVFLACTARTVL